MKNILFLLIVLSSFHTLAQIDTLNNLDINKISRSRNLISAGYYRSTPYTLNNSETIVLDGIELNNNQGYFINGMLPIYVPQKGNIRVMANYGYLSTTFNNSKASLNDSLNREIDERKYETHRYTFSPMAIINYKIGNRTVVNMLQVSLNSYEFFDPSYYTIMLSTNVILKRTQQKSSSIGIALIHSNDMDWPIIPIPMFAYNTFLNRKWTFEMMFPYSIGFRRIQNEKLMLKSEVKLDVLNSLFRPQYYNDVTRFSDMGVAAAINVNYKLYKRIEWNLDVSYKYSIGPRIIDVNTGDEIFEFDSNAKFIFNTGFSFSL